MNGLKVSPWLILSLLLVACENPTATVPSDTNEQASLTPSVDETLRQMKQQLGIPERFDPEFVDLGLQIPGYAGHYFDEGVMTVHLQDLTQAQAAQSRLAPFASDYAAWHRQSALPQMQFKQVEFNAVELSTWRLSLYDALESFAISAVDTDIRTNRVGLYLYDMADSVALSEALIERGVPIEAVTIQYQEKLVFSQGDLTDYTNDLAPGIQFAFWNSDLQQYEGCTIGLNAEGKDTEDYFGWEVFIAPSHCTDDFAQVDFGTTDAYQPNQLYSPVGYEVYDAPTFTSLDTGACWSGYLCRWGDIAVYRYSTNRTVHWARIVRTEGPGSTTKDSFVPYFDVTSYRASRPWPGYSVSMMGKDSGWTTGQTLSHCTDYPITWENEDYVILCQVETDYPNQGGDSGAPVFQEGFSDEATIWGFHSGSLENGNGVFTPWVDFQTEFDWYADFCYYIGQGECGSSPTPAPPPPVSAGIQGPSEAPPFSECSWSGSASGGDGTYQYDWYWDGAWFMSGAEAWRDVGGSGYHELKLIVSDGAGDTDTEFLTIDVHNSAEWCGL